MQDSMEELLPDTCSILSYTNVSDGHGGQTATEGTVSTPKCRVDFQNGIIQLAGGALQPYSRMLLTLPHDTTISPTNKVLWNGARYSISSVSSESFQSYRVAEIHANA